MDFLGVFDFGVFEKTIKFSPNIVLFDIVDF
jgi:hypothetical protein